jgi:hypothetical protein
MRLYLVAAAVLLAGCSSNPPAPPVTAAPTLAHTGDSAAVAAVRAYAPPLRAADRVISGCPTDATPVCVTAATDDAAPAAAALTTGLGAGADESAPAATLAAAAGGLVKAVRDYQGNPTTGHWAQVVLASSTVVQLLDTDWARYGI